MSHIFREKVLENSKERVSRCSGISFTFSSCIITKLFNIVIRRNAKRNTERNANQITVTVKRAKEYRMR